MEDYPDGYPRLAALMDSDNNTRLYRRFGVVRNRLLLHKQDQIAELSEKLSKIDHTDSLENPVRLICRRYDEELGDESARTQVIQELEHRLKEYDDLLLREHAIVALPRPTVQNHRSIFNWVYNNKPLTREEYSYLYNERDCLLLGNQQDHCLRSLQDFVWNLGQSPIFKVCPTETVTSWNDGTHLMPSDYFHPSPVPRTLMQRSSQTKLLRASYSSS